MWSAFLQYRGEDMGTIEFWTGSSGVGKSHRMFSEIFAETAREPLGSYIYIITPTQNTLRYETELTQHELGGSLRTGVFSFSRFTWHVMNEIAFETKDSVSEHSQILLLFQIMQRLHEEGQLQYFKDSANELDFSKKVLDMIKELNRYHISPDTLSEVDYTHPSTREKMQDVILIYREWQRRVTSLNIEDFNINQQLIDVLERYEHLTTLNDATIYIDGFHNFTEGEMALIVALSKRVKQVTILLLHVDISAQPELFRKTDFVINRIRDLADGNIRVQVIDDESHRAKKAGLQQVEQQLLYPNQKQHITNYDGVSFIHAQNVNQEMTEVARQIENLTYHNGANYSEIAVLYRDTDVLPALGAALERFNINYQLDTKVPMRRHPFIKFIIALIDCYQNNYNQKSFTNLLKLGYLTDKSDEPLLYTLENLILERGLTGSALKDDRYFTSVTKVDEDGEVHTSFESDHIAACIHLKNEVIEKLDNFYNHLDENTDALTFSYLIYEFLEENDILNALNTTLDELETTHPYRHSETVQAYQLLITLLDDFVLLFKEDTMPLDTLLNAFTEALVESEFNLLPATIDQVTVGNLDLAKVENKKYVFLVAMTSENMPVSISDVSVISDREKADFNAYNIHFSPTSTELANDEKFVFYHAVTRPTDGLFISWSDYNANSTLTKVSPFVAQLLPEDSSRVLNYNYFKVCDYGLQPARLVSSIYTMMPELYARLEQLIGELLETGAVYSSLPKRSGIVEINTQWLKVLKLLKSYDIGIAGYSAFEEVLNYIKFKNISEKLDESVALDLYKHPMHASVSRFEMFNRCQFQHLSQYGLKLNVRKPYAIEALDTGVLIHNVLETLYKSYNRSLKQLKNEDIENVVRDIVDKEALKIAFGIFNRSAVNQMIKRHTTERVMHVVKFLKSIEEHSRYETKEIELSFGMQDKRFPALKLKTHDGYEVNLRGKIDRLEIFEDTYNAYVNIIDYKSSERDLKRSDVLMGVELQLLTYMYYVLHHYDSDKALEPNSMLYYPVIKPRLSDSDNLIQKDVYNLMIEKLRPKGLFISNSKVLSDNEGLSNMAEPTTKLHEFFRIELSKGNTEINGRSMNSRILSTDVLTRYMDYVINTYKEVTDDIYKGHTKINPLAPQTKSGFLPCNMCDFKNACRIDLVMDRDLERPYDADNEKLKQFEA